MNIGAIDAELFQVGLPSVEYRCWDKLFKKVGFMTMLCRGYKCVDIMSP